jgi:NitT/TauT family transport system substrate-binding protein
MKTALTSLRPALMAFSAAALCILTVPSAGPAAAADLGIARLSWAPGPDTPQVALAIDRGLWTKRGLAVQTSSTPTGREALEALIGGQVDYALMAELPPVIGALQHQNFRIIATLSRYGAYRIVGTSSVDPASLTNLSGHKIGTTLGTNVDFQSYIVQLQSGIRGATMVNAPPADLVPALARGDIDAAFMFPQFYPLAKKVLGSRYREHRTPVYASTFTLVASTDEIARHPDRVKAVLAGLVGANKLVVNDLAASAAVVSHAMGGVVSPADIQALWADYHFDILLDRKFIELLDREGHWVHDGGAIKGPEPTVQTFLSYVDSSFLSAVAPANVQLK